MRRAGVAVIALALALGANACMARADEDAGVIPDPAPSGDDAGATTTDAVIPVFTGDPDSPFCELVRDADDAPVLDPFDAGLEPREVELRLRALRVRFTDFAEVAPPELDEDLAAVVASLAELDALLDANDYDFDAVVESGADISIVSDPAFNSIGTRLLAYRDQVCDA